MNKFIYGFIRDKLKGAFIAALVFSVFFLIIDYKFIIQYFIGFLIGCVNFIGLSLGTEYLISYRPRKSSIINFLFFTVRYIIVAYLIAQTVMKKGWNPLVIVLGFLTLNLSIRYSAFREYFLAKKEG